MTLALALALALTLILTLIAPDPDESMAGMVRSRLPCSKLLPSPVGAVLADIVLIAHHTLVPWPGDRHRLNKGAVERLRAGPIGSSKWCRQRVRPCIRRIGSRHGSRHGPGGGQWRCRFGEVDQGNPN